MISHVFAQRNIFSNICSVLHPGILLMVDINKYKKISRLTHDCYEVTFVKT